MGEILGKIWRIIRNSEPAEEQPQLSEAETPEVNAERRVVQRYPGPLPATMSAGLSSFPESVTMRDLNEKGLYVYSSTAFPRGATVEVVTELPSALSAYGKRRVHYTASVVRVEENVGEGTYGIAAIIKKCEVLPPREEVEMDDAVSDAKAQPETKQQARDTAGKEKPRPGNFPVTSKK